jgi:HK97 gp10 family phage protein
MVQGLDKLKAKLNRAGVGLKQAVGPAMEAGGDRVLATARLMVPKESGRLAGTLRRTGVETTKRGNLRVSVLAGDETTVRGPIQIAKSIEFGTTRMPAQPYLGPALRLNKRPIMAEIRRAMRTAIKKANGAA